MKNTSIDLLECPTCHSDLVLQAASGKGTIETGSLVCFICHKEYLIRQGITHFIKEEELVGLNKKFAHLYDWFSWIYGAFSKIGFLLLGTSEAQARHEILDRLELKGRRVLEVSVGPGVNLPFLFRSPAIGEVYGLDISIGQLNRCNALIRRKGWPVDLFLGNGEELPFKDESFDSVFHIGGINFFSNKKKAIDEMIRVAKAGTKIIICDENEKGARQYEKFLPSFKRAFEGQREKVTAPVELVPSNMLDVKLEDVWNGFMYCLEFKKPFEIN